MAGLPEVEDIVMGEGGVAEGSAVGTPVGESEKTLGQPAKGGAAGGGGKGKKKKGKK